MHRPFFALLLMFTLLPASAHAQIGGLGVFGDSLSDEYFEAGYGAYSRNWTVLAAQIRGLNLGPTAAAAGQPGGTWGSPRRTGYAANWALAGASSITALSTVTNHSATIQNQVNSGQITHGVLCIGANDFYSGTAAYNGIYNGTWTPAQIQAYADTVYNNITATSLNLQNRGIRLVLSSVPDYGVSVATRTSHPDAARRELVTVVIGDLNDRLRTYAQNQGLVYADLDGMARAIFGTNASPNASVTIGGQVINLNGAGIPATNGFVGDGIHPHTVLQAEIGALFLEGLRQGYNTGVARFTEQEAVEAAGLIFLGNSAPFTPGQFVINFVPVPEPSLVLLLVATGAGVDWYRRKIGCLADTGVESES